MNLEKQPATPLPFVNSDPLNRFDPSGLYQSDIHYYMTFFLAVASGVNVEEAQFVALADQYIDDNEATEAVAPTTGHITLMLSYHFTPVTSSVDPATGLLLNGFSQYGKASWPRCSTAIPGRRHQHLQAA